MANKGNNRCLLQDPYGTHKCFLWENAEFLNVSAGGTCNYQWILKLLKYNNMKVWTHLDNIRDRSIFYRNVRLFV
jgi:hypothetical protein